MSNAGSSCTDIYENHPETRTKSGYYRISDNRWTYYNMTEFHDIPTTQFYYVGRGWKRTAKLILVQETIAPVVGTKVITLVTAFARSHLMVQAVHL